MKLRKMLKTRCLMMNPPTAILPMMIILKPLISNKGTLMFKENNEDLLTFGGHLEVLRRMLFRIIAVAGTLAIVIFCFKDITWRLLLAPSECSFTTYKLIENLMSSLGFDFRFEQFSVDLIATDLSSQFMTHITTSVYLGLLGASPYILFELFRFACIIREREEIFGTSGGDCLYSVHSGSTDELLCIVPDIFQVLGNIQRRRKNT